MQSAAAAAAAAADSSGGIAISLRQRGLTALLDDPAAARAARSGACAAAGAEASSQIASLFCALLAAIVTLPPWAWFSALLCSLAAVFFVGSGSAALTDGLVVTFAVTAGLMVVYMAAAAVARRDQGARLLGQVKACIISIDCLADALPPPPVTAQPLLGTAAVKRAAAIAAAHAPSAAAEQQREESEGEEEEEEERGEVGDEGDDEDLEDAPRAALRVACLDLMDALVAYLGGPLRPNTEAFAWSLLSRASAPGPSLYNLSLDIGTRIRRVQSATRNVASAAATLARRRGAGGDAVAAALLSRAADAHAAAEGLSALKELRTPLLLRVTARSYVVLVGPILTGSALAGLARSAPGAAALVWSVAVGCMLQLLLASLLAVATQLEDPFASPHPDALSVWEARDGVDYMLFGAGRTGAQSSDGWGPLLPDATGWPWGSSSGGGGGGGASGDPEAGFAQGVPMLKAKEQKRRRQQQHGAPSGGVAMLPGGGQGRGSSGGFGVGGGGGGGTAAAGEGQSGRRHEGGGSRHGGGSSRGGQQHLPAAYMPPMPSLGS